MLLYLLFTRDDDQQEFYRKSYLFSFNFPNRGSLSRLGRDCDLWLLIKRPEPSHMSHVCQAQMSDRVTASSRVLGSPPLTASGYVSPCHCFPDQLQASKHVAHAKLGLFSCNFGESLTVALCWTIQDLTLFCVVRAKQRNCSEQN